MDPFDHDGPSSMVIKLAALKPPPPKPARPDEPRKRPLTEQEGIALILAVRRGVPIRQIEREIGMRYGSIYSKLGAWAMAYARVSA